MKAYFTTAIIFILIGLVLFRSFQLRKLGIKAMRFGEKDKKDFLIPPFVLFYLYLIVASSTNLPKVGIEIFNNEVIGWVGVLLCILGVILFSYALISFGKSFRVGIDDEHPGELITNGAFSISRNPIYTAFGLIMAGIFLVTPNWIFLIYLVVGVWLFKRQIQREEESLTKTYGDKYMEYCKKVRRFL